MRLDHAAAKKELQAALDTSRLCTTQAAELLGVGLATMKRWIDALGLRAWLEQQRKRRGIRPGPRPR